MLTSSAKKQILNSILDLVLDFSNKQYQKNAWIKGEMPGYAFDDSVCDFFGSCNPVLENHKDFGISNEQFSLLKKFRDEFKAFTDDNSWPPFFIDTPEWAKIIENSKEVLAIFNYKKNDSN